MRLIKTVCWVGGFFLLVIGVLGVVGFIVTRSQQDQGKGLNGVSRPTFTSKGDRILLSLEYPKRHIGRIYEIDLSGNILRSFFDDTHSESMPNFSQDGSKIVYVQEEGTHESSIWIYDVKTEKREPLTGPHFLKTDPSFSVDGQKIVFSKAMRWTTGHMGGMTWYDWGIGCIDLGTKKVCQIGSRKYYRTMIPHYSKNGDSVFVIREDSSTDDARMQLDQQFVDRDHVIQVLDQELYFFAMSRDRTKLLYKHDRRGGGASDSVSQHGTWLVFKDLETGAVREIVIPLDDFHSFDISADLSKIIFLVEQKKYGNYAIYLYNIPTKTLKKIQIKDRGRIVEE